MAKPRALAYNTSSHAGELMSVLSVGCLVESGAIRMPTFALRVGSRTAQGVRSNNEDSFVVDLCQRLFVVADGMGGQDRGEVASSMAVEIIPRAVHARLAVNESRRGRPAARDAGSERHDRRSRPQPARRPTHGDDRRRRLAAQWPRLHLQSRRQPGLPHSRPGRASVDGGPFGGARRWSTPGH